MNLEMETIPAMSIEDFSDRHGLTMVVKERPTDVRSPFRYFACFKDAEVMEHGMLCSAIGNGATPEAAIGEYARRISLKRLAINAFGPERHEINVPRLQEH
jgi:hypothetical protein